MAVVIGGPWPDAGGTSQASILETMQSEDPAMLARLVIHPRDQGNGAGAIRRLLENLAKGLVGLRSLRQPDLRIHDLDGRAVVVIAQDRSGVEVSLPAGTYHVSDGDDTDSRRYTVALQAGASVDLYVHTRPRNISRR